MEEKITEKMPIESFRPNPWNTNYLLDSEREKLCDEMASSGPEKTPPVIARRVGDLCEIIDGEQRWRIADELGWREIYARIIDVGDEEAKLLCLSYNFLRGRVDWFKLSEIMAQDEKKGSNVYFFYEKVLAKEEINAVLDISRMAPEARKVLREGIYKGVEITLGHFALIQQFPQRYQPEMANLAVVKGAGIGELKQLLQFYTRRTEANRVEVEKTEDVAETQKKPLDAKPTEILSEDPMRAVAPDEVGEREIQEEQKGTTEREKPEGDIIEETVIVKALFECDCNRKFLVNFEEKEVSYLREERGLIGMKRMPLSAYAMKVTCPECGSEHTLDKPSSSTLLEIKCKCGLEGRLDFDDEEVAWRSV